MENVWRPGRQVERGVCSARQGGHDYIPQTEALRGPSYHSDIGIDDIEFRTGQCNCHTIIRKYLTKQSMFSLVSIYNIYQS